MFDFSQISGTAPGPVVDRTTPGAGSPAVVAVSGAGAGSFLDALAALAALSMSNVPDGDAAEFAAGVDGERAAPEASESELSASDDSAAAVALNPFIAAAYPPPVAQVPVSQPPVSDLTDTSSGTQTVPAAVGQTESDTPAAHPFLSVGGESAGQGPTPKGEAEVGRTKFSATYERQASPSSTTPEPAHAGTSARSGTPAPAAVPAEVVVAETSGAPPPHVPSLPAVVSPLAGRSQHAAPVPAEIAPTPTGASSSVSHPSPVTAAPTPAVDTPSPSATPTPLQSIEAQSSAPAVSSDVRRGGRGRFVLDQFGSARAEVKRPDTSTASAPAAAPGLPPPAVATAFVPEVSSPATSSTAGSQAAGPLAGPSAVASQDGRSSMDSRDPTAGFGPGGHGPAGPRPALAPAPPAVTTFASMVTSGPSGDVLPAETMSQIVQSIRMQLLRDGGEAHIRLDPRQFGDMSVRIRVDQGQVTARVEADAPVVREWLQNNQHLLRQSLAGQQLTLDRLDVREPPATPDTSRRDGSPERERDAPQQRPRRRRPDTGELFEVVA